jgi:putative addiction module component (TIGR02574 family)
MSNDTFSRLRSEVLTLPESERAQLAHELVSSLDAPADVDVADAWDREIVRRLSEIETGTASAIDVAEFRRRLKARIANP